VKKRFIQTPTDFSIEAPLAWTRAISFSHENHSRRSGCDMFHPEIYPSAPKEAVPSSMFVHLEGRYCGACHGKVAFPLNNCSQCHLSGGPRTIVSSPSLPE
jgi:c(7)-type cytochrome triheme protein